MWSLSPSISSLAMSPPLFWAAVLPTLAAILLLVPGTVAADTIYLKSGRVIHSVETRIAEGNVTFWQFGSWQSIPLSVVERVVDDPSRGPEPRGRAGVDPARGGSHGHLSRRLRDLRPLTLGTSCRGARDRQAIPDVDVPRATCFDRSAEGWDSRYEGLLFSNFKNVVQLT